MVSDIVNTRKAFCLFLQRQTAHSVRFYCGRYREHFSGVNGIPPMYSIVDKMKKRLETARQRVSKGWIMGL